MVNKLSYDYLELSNSSSNKFYEVTFIFATSTLVKRWGRIGTVGQMQIEQGVAFVKALDLRDAKTRKGYLSVSDEITDKITPNEAESLTTLAENKAKEQFVVSLDVVLANAGFPGCVPAIPGGTQGFTPSTTIIDEVDVGDTGVFGSDPGQDEVAAEHLSPGLLAKRAQRLIPAVAQSPLEYAVAVAEVREAAAVYRTELRTLESHLTLLDTLLTEGLAR